MCGMARLGGIKNENIIRESLKVIDISRKMRENKRKRLRRVERSNNDVMLQS